MFGMFSRILSGARHTQRRQTEHYGLSTDTAVPSLAPQETAAVVPERVQMPDRGDRNLKIAIVTQPWNMVVAGEAQRGSVTIVNWELARCLAERYTVTV